jgi:hypothetical protein
VLGILLLLGLPLLVCSSGCAVLYQLAYGDGPKIEAKYAGLKDKRVAVVCVMNSSSYGDGEVSAALADAVGRILRAKVDDIDVVRPQEVSDWMDTNEWDESDFVEVGRVVKAEVVLAIDVDSFSVHESKTLLKGRSHLTTTVYEVKDGKELFRTTDYDHTFPTSHAVPAISTDWRKFQRMYVQVLAEHIAKNFYDYDMAEDFATDAAAYAH